MARSTAKPKARLYGGELVPPLGPSPQWQPHKDQLGPGRGLQLRHMPCQGIDALVSHIPLTSSLSSLSYADEKQWPLIHLE